jgi:hypothetical protein
VQADRVGGEVFDVFEGDGERPRHGLFPRMVDGVAGESPIGGARETRFVLL